MDIKSFPFLPEPGHDGHSLLCEVEPMHAMVAGILLFFYPAGFHQPFDYTGQGGFIQHEDSGEFRGC